MSLDGCGVRAVLIGVLNELLVSVLGVPADECAVSKLYYMKLEREAGGGCRSASRAIGSRGEWSVENGEWRVECGVWSVECGVWSVECGVWSSSSD